MSSETAWALSQILSEPLASASRRRRDTFDQLAGGPDKPIVLCGAGGLGRIVLQGLRKLGKPPVAFVDRKAGASSEPIDDIPVTTAVDAVARFGKEAVFVVTIWNAQTDHRYPATREELRGLGAMKVAPAIALFWKYPETYLPYYCLDVPERVLRAQDEILRLDKKLADEDSRDVLLRQVRWRVNMDFEALPRPVEGPAYLQADLFAPLDNELFVDCGAYDGDTLRAFLPRMKDNRARMICIEPDPTSYAHLEACVSTLPVSVRERVRTLRAAAGRVRERLRFESSGLASSRTSETGAIEVDCLPLDDVLHGETPTFVKMDLEGSEVDALLGAEVSIRRSGPSMAICVYHRPSHLWEIPLLLHQMLPKHKLYLRPHGYEGWDLVCYAVASRPS